MEHSDFDEAIQTQLTFWKSVLCLNDWAIRIEYWPHEALGGSVSKVSWSRNQKSAIIALRLPEDLPPVERDWPEGEASDYDLSLVHELLHLHCVDMECKQDWAEEQLCNHIAKALVSFYRNGNPQSPHPSPSVGGVDSKDRHPGHFGYL